MDFLTCEACGNYKPDHGRYELFPNEPVYCNSCLWTQIKIDHDNLQDKLARYQKNEEQVNEYYKYKKTHPDIDLHTWHQLFHSPIRPTKDIDYAFTLTASPAMGLTADSFLTAVRKIFEYGQTSKGEKIQKGAYVIEYHENGSPHLHGVYRGPEGRRILQKYWKRQWKHWDESKHIGSGHFGGYHQKARHTESYEAYIAKDGDVISYDAVKTV